MKVITINEKNIKSEFDRASVILVDIGITTLSGSRPLLNEYIPMKNTITIIIGINIIPDRILIKIKWNILNV